MHIQIQDQGIGIPSDAIDNIFDAYSRVESERTRYIKGTGLGLAIVKQIVQMHGGKVWAESQHMKRTTFHVVLPLCQDRGFSKQERLQDAISSPTHLY